ncbi:MAG: F0F1 ATP synthase subunit B [Oscillospiraceae bacterium]
MGFQEFVSMDFVTLIFQLGNLLILYKLVKHFLFKPVQKVLATRQGEVDKLYSEANEANASAKALREDYEKHLSEAKEEAGEIIKTATQTAQAQGDEIVAEAQKKAADLISRANAEIAQDKKKTINEIKNDISGIAMDIATKVVGREISEKDHEKLIEEFISNVGDAS